MIYLRRRRRQIGTGFDPSKHGNIFAWYKADGLNLLNGQTVSIWPDNSKNGNNASVSGVGGVLPNYQANILNGLPVIRFGGNRFFSTGKSSLIQSIFVIFNESADDLNSGLFGGDEGISGNHGLRKTAATTLESLRYGATTGTIWLNGSSSGTTISTSPSASFKLVYTQLSTPQQFTNIYIANYYPYLTSAFLGDIAEMIIFRNIPNRLAVENYLKQKYGFTY